MTLRPFDEIVTEHGAVVLRVCRALLPATDADDAWSEAFLAALRAYPDLAADANVRGWLVTIAHRKAIDILRRTARHAVPVAEPPERIGITVDGAPLDEQLRQAMASLPIKQRGAVVYRYLADLGYDEIGELLGCSAVAARRNAADGIKALRARLPQGVQP